MLPAPFIPHEIATASPGVRRAVHALAFAAPWRFARRVLEVGAEVLAARVTDWWAARQGPRQPIIRQEDGADPMPGARRVAMFVHFSPGGEVSEMVLRQLTEYRTAGFAIVFLSMAPQLRPEAWAAVGQVCALVVHRRNFARDFGAWHDLAPQVMARWPGAEELLLANDSVLGPLRPLGPLFAAARAAGDGLFGLSESRQGGVHLQSYFLLARGAGAVAALFGFLQEMRLSRSKWLVVQRGELALARSMREAGHRVYAFFPYAPLVAAAVADAPSLAALRALNPRLGALPDTAALAENLLRWPTNPTHHLWRPLVALQGFPFLKTELVRRNPGHLDGVAAWPEVVTDDAPCPLPVIQAHLAEMGA